MSRHMGMTDRRATSRNSPIPFTLSRVSANTGTPTNGRPSTLYVIVFQPARGGTTE